jgi:hypothetical protein
LVSSYIYSCFSWKNCLEDFRSTAYLQTCSRKLQQNPEWRSALPKKSLAWPLFDTFLPTKRIDSAIIPFLLFV